MECPHIQERLSEYIDGRLSPQEKAAVNEHLRSCTGCTTALDDLKKTVGYMKDLGTVEPPAWLTQKVMGKIRAQARPKGGLFRKLFYPLHVKLPIEAVATVIVVGLALYIYRGIVPEVRVAQSPEERSGPQVSPDKQQPAPSAPSSKPIERSSLSREGDTKADKLTRSSVQEAEKREGGKAPAPAKSLEQLPATGAIARDAGRAAGAVAPEAKLSETKERNEKPLIFTVFVKDPETAAKEVRKTLKDLEGRAIHTEPTGEKEVITAKVNAARLKELIASLKATGKTEEGEIGLAAMKGEVGVRVELVKTFGGE